MKPQAIRQAYRKLARSFHPDVNPDPKSHEQMAKINSAFETLIDPVRRMEYDASLNGGLIEDPRPDSGEARAAQTIRAKLVHRLRNHKTPIYSVMFAPGSGQLVSSSFDNELLWWDLDEEAVARNLRLEGGVVSVIELLDDGRVVAAGCSETTVSLWRIADNEVQTFRSIPYEWVCCLKASPNGKAVAFGTVHRSLVVTNSDTGQTTFSATKHGDSVTAVAWSADGRFIATGSADATVKLWNVANGEELYTFSNVRSTVTSLAFSNDTGLLAVGAVDLSIRVFNLRTMSLCKAMHGHEKPIEALAFHPNNKLLGSAGRDGYVGLWNAYDGVGHGRIEASHLPLATVTFSPDGKQLAAGGLDKVLRVWNISVNN